MQLPVYKDSNTNFMLMQNKWSSVLNPLLANPLNNAVVLDSVVLKTGSNVINTTLGRKPQGWFIVDIDSSAQVYRSAPFNNLTLTLTSSGNATITLVVF